MCFRPKGATVTRGRRSKGKLPAKPPQTLAMLDLSKPVERQAHDFLVRATSKDDRMWEMITLRRVGDVLLCVVRWVHLGGKALCFALAEVSLTEIAVCWRDFVSIEGAREEMERRCAVAMSAEEKT